LEIVSQLCYAAILANGEVSNRLYTLVWYNSFNWHSEGLGYCLCECGQARGNSRNNTAPVVRLRLWALVTLRPPIQVMELQA
jgi:hypothetical protein